MTELIRKVGTHGPPNPDEHPWVMTRQQGRNWVVTETAKVAMGGFRPGVEWVPWAPPTEYAPEPEPEGVEIDGTLWRERMVADRPVLQYLNREGVWRDHPSGDYVRLARVAQALGLVPGVPQGLIDWAARWRNHPDRTTDAWYVLTQLIEAIEAGEFGAVEPSVKPAPMSPEGAGSLGYMVGELRPSVEWVTDRLPRDDEYPVFGVSDLENGGTHESVYTFIGVEGRVDRWVSVEALLDAARLR